MTQQISGLQAIHHFERRAMEYRRLSFSLAVAADLGRLDGQSRFVVRSTAITLRQDASCDETLLANLKLWMLTTSGLRAAEIDDSVFVDLQGFKSR